MAHTDVKLTIDPAIIGKLDLGSAALWTAAHSDGSDNRVNWDAVFEAETVDTSLGILTAVFQGLRKAFRNRGKTREDLAAEREAAQINRTCVALRQMLLEYLLAAQAGCVEEEALDELIETLAEMHGYQRSGKLSITGKSELATIAESIAEYTDAIARSRDPRAFHRPEAPAEDAFCRISEHLMRQKAWVGAKPSL